MPKEIVSVAVEGVTDTEVVARVFDWLAIGLGNVYGERGKAYLDARLSAWNEAAKYSPWVVLRDLDRDAVCASDLVKDLLPSPSSFMRFRIAVRSIEAWLLADSEKLAEFLAIKRAAIPTDPDAVIEPKRALVELARQSSRREIRMDFVPRAGTSAKVGPAFAAGIIEFTRLHWRPETATHRSESLRRFVAAVSGWQR
ncbi:MAG TPA: hypothetical protein VMT03_20395 [Polyangia bacterium]|nr:hypothetical protein [Polyangia bacterium]